MSSVFVGVFEKQHPTRRVPLTLPVILKSKSLEDATDLLKVVESASEYTLTKVEPIEDFLQGTIYCITEYSTDTQF